ncbi:MAG: universal stress protein [Gammaproteobacteria bacterium]|nr:universal stress protein [Gammaproteobacteria bacterium]
MTTLLVATDGSEFGLRAADYALRRHAVESGPVRVHLLNVQPSLAGVNVKLFIRQGSLDAYYREEGEAALESAAARLRSGGIEPTLHIGVGEAAAKIAEFARSTGADEIIIGAHGRGFLADAVVGSVALAVVRSASVPVVLVP